MTHTPPNKEPQEDVRSFAGRLLAFADAVILHGTNWVRDWDYAIRHREYLDELEESGQLDALLEVTGATREQLRASELSPLAAFELLHRMMRKLDIDPAETSAPAMAEAQWRCRLCPSWRECRHWLDRDASDERYREFCSNASLLDRMRTRAGAAGDV